MKYLVLLAFMLLSSCGFNVGDCYRGRTGVLRINELVSKDAYKVSIFGGNGHWELLDGIHGEDAILYWFPDKVNCPKY